MATKSKAPDLEIPEQLRDMTEKSFETAQQAFNDFMSQTKESLAKAVDTSEELQSSARDAQSQAMAFAEANVTAAMEFGRRMAGAATPDEMLELQKQFAEAQMKAMSTQSEAVAEIAKNMTRAVGKD